MKNGLPIGSPFFIIWFVLFLVQERANPIERPGTIHTENTTGAGTVAIHAEGSNTSNNIGSAKEVGTT